ncbi:MAG TPA: GatB/YqeY domain-containing protein [Gammaproteobacteria bacterium]|nr:GatB/YqeY domain-containing protein [Gammaproteobacteria bacterium]
MASTLKNRITDDMKSAMRAKDKQRLLTIRLILAAIKQREVDERCELNDSDIVALLDKMAKQRRESIEQYRQANREELERQEQFELNIIREYLPAALSEAEIEALITQAINSTGASTMQEMGKVMGLLKPKLQGRADLGAVSVRIKTLLS